MTATAKERRLDRRIRPSLRRRLLGHVEEFKNVRFTPMKRIQIMAATESKDIADAASAVLASSSVAELRALRVDEESNELQLHGNVRSFYHKQLAQEAVLPLAGRLQVVNNVDVRG